MKSLKTILTATLLLGTIFASAQSMTRLSTRWQNKQAKALKNRLERKNKPISRPQLIATTGDGTELWGSIVYADSWAEAYWRGEYVPFGYYAFKANNDNNFEDLSLDEAMQADGGAVILNDTLHLVHDIYGYGSHGVVYSTYNVKNWQLIGQKALSDFGLSAFDLALDPVSGKVYGEFSSSDSDQAGFGTIDFATLQKQVVPMDTTFVGLAFNSLGQLYGINLDGNLYTIDKNTGAYTLVGPTGIIPSSYRQSATFDLSTNKLYYTAQTQDNKSGLYEVNTTTGKATLIKQFDDNQEICGLMVPQRGVTSGSPEKVKDLTVSFSEGALSGTVGFTAPSQTINGMSIQTVLNYYIVVNGDTLAKGNIQPNENKNVNITVDHAGFYRFDVITRNEAGFSQPARQKIAWIGYDTPITSISSFNIDQASNKASLQWSTKEDGVNTGYIDNKALTYTVIRYPEKVVVSKNQRENVFTEILPQGEKMLYQYAVVANNHDIMSDTILSEELALGTSRSIPYNEEFKTKGTVSQLCPVINSNKDATTWQWTNYQGGAATYDSDNAQTYGDDWLLTPLLKMEPGRKYNLAFNACGNDGNRIQVKFGQGDAPTDRQQFKVIIKTTELHNAIDTLINKEVEVTEAGLYRFAFHATSGPRVGVLYLNNVKVEVRSVYGAPQKVTEIKVIPAPKANKSSSISMVAPTTGTDGKALQSISHIDVYRNAKIIKKIDSPAPGRQISFVDDTPINGYNTYTFIPYNDLGEGERDSVKVFIGQDQPLDIKNLKLTDNLNGTASLSWNAPDTIGVNGGYVDSTQVDYEVYYGNYTQYSPDSVLHGKTQLDMDIRTKDFQANLYFNVRAKTVQGVSDYTVSNLIVQGAPYELPFSESFPTSNYETIWWRDYATTNNAFRYNIGESSDNDNGSIYWYPTKTCSEGEVCSGMIDINSAEHPQLSFDYFVNPKFDGQWEVSISKDGKEYNTAWTTDMATDNGNERWEKAHIDLSSYLGSKYIIIKFKAISHQVDNHGLFLDNIVVKNVNSHDLAIELSVPKTGRKGKENKMSVTVKNIGNADEPTALLTVKADADEIFSVDLDPLKQGKDTTCVFAYIPKVTDNAQSTITAYVDLPSDDNQADNSAQANVALADNSFSRPQHLVVAPSTNGGIALVWSAPNSSDNTVDDDIEDYSSWITSNIGDWTTWDGDKKTSYSINNMYFPHSNEPYAFLVFNPQEIGMDTNSNEYANMKAHSGSQYLICFDAVSSKNNDWLISPKLSGMAQNIRFFAKNIGATSGSFVEQFNVLYSTTGANVSDFISLTATPVSATDEWTKYSFNLPDGAKHFALQVVSEDQFALMIDDIHYQAEQLVLTGYNIYRNGKLISTVPATSTTFIDTDAEANENTLYSISAVYTIGESSMCRANSIAGVNSVTVNNDDNIDARYRLDGIRTWQNRGLQIVKMKNGAMQKIITK